MLVRIEQLPRPFAVVQAQMLSKKGHCPVIDRAGLPSKVDGETHGEGPDG